MRPVAFLEIKKLVSSNLFSTLFFTNYDPEKNEGKKTKTKRQLFMWNLEVELEYFQETFKRRVFSLISF